MRSSGRLFKSPGNSDSMLTGNTVSRPTEEAGERLNLRDIGEYILLNKDKQQASKP
jgi:hypothetical protein